MASRPPPAGDAPPLPADVHAAVRTILSSGTRVVVYAAGGGSWATAWLLVSGGGSSTVLETRVPYSRRSFLSAVGLPSALSLSSFADVDAARALARAAFWRAVRLAPAGARVLGVGAACALAAGGRRGEDRAHVAAFGDGRMADYSLKLGPGGRLRQEEMAARLVLQALADGACGTTEGRAFSIAGGSGFGLLRDRIDSGDVLTGPVVAEAGDPVAGLLRGDIKFVELCGARAAPEATCADVLLPGSFNPVHRGHRRLLDAAVDAVRAERGEAAPVQGAFEMSVANPDKPSLARDDVVRRAALFGEAEVVVVSRAALFRDKAMLYPGVTFVVGVDTAVRLVMPKYYGGFEPMMEALGDIRAQGCTVLVAARVNEAGQVLTLRDVDVPPGARGLFREIPESQFREDVSSTEIRSVANNSNVDR